MSRADLIALFGPTGVGKTDVAIALGRRLRELGELPVAVSADALQVYEGLQTLTGAATAGERRELEHRLISVVPVDASFSAGQYAELAHAEIDSLLAAGRRPIVVGGTGLYLRAALTSLNLKPPPPEGIRERWTAELERRGPRALHTVLSERAPSVAGRIDPADRQRIVRALELLDAGELEGDDPGDPAGGQSQLWSGAVRRPTLLVGLTMDRDRLYARIDSRVDEMLAAGAGEEVRRANAAGASLTARKALGFEELLAGDVDGMKRRTRNYARRQLTWMRKLGGIETLDTTARSPDDVARAIVDLWLAQTRSAQGSGVSG
jgi:tRNA dimethylallyltransferase